MNHQIESETRLGQFTTLVDLLRYRALNEPEHVVYTFLPEGEGQGIDLTYAEVDARARALAVELIDRGAQGERALMLFPSGLDFLIAFFACQYAGVVAVPAYPPRKNQKIERLQAIVKDCQPKIVLATASVRDISQPLFAELQGLDTIPFLTVDQIDRGIAEHWREPVIKADDLAFLQYTSGSTGDPKGVMLSHANLMYNQEMIRLMGSLDHTSRYVSWLPLFHDMGLGNSIQSIYISSHCVLMPPASFVQKPQRWLRAISDYRAHISGGPNFAYDLCVKNFRRQDYEGVDLSCWKGAFSGAEPVRAATFDGFYEIFSDYGFNRSAFYPCYGLAEATVAVCGGNIDDAPVEKTLCIEALSCNKVEFKKENNEHTDRYLASGFARLEDEIVIVNPDSGNPSGAGEVGEIWISSPSVGSGYWGRDELSKEVFKNKLPGKEANFLRTGDLGFIDDRQLFVTGRKKDLIIIRGRNYYPQDIELCAVQSHANINAYSCAAFSVEHSGQSHLVVVAEVERRALRKFSAEPVVESIRQAISKHFEIQVSAIGFLKPGRLPKTSSGKVMRKDSAAKFRSDGFEYVSQWVSPTYRASTQSTQSSLENKLYGTQGAFELPPQRVKENKTSQQVADELILWLRDYASARINSFEIDERRTIPPYIALDLGNKGLFSLQIPKQYGGLDLSNSDALRIIEQLAAVDGSLALWAGLNNSLGVIPIRDHGSEEIKANFLPEIAQGRLLASFAVTEDGAGSNPWGINSVAKRTGNTWSINGQKEWIGNGAWSNLIITFAHARDQQGKPLGISGFLVRQGSEGLQQGPEALTMGMRGIIQNRIFYNDVKVTDDAVLGAIGQGMEIAQSAMMHTRVGIAAISLGMLKRCAQLIIRYASRRPIATGLLLDNPVCQSQFNEIHCRVLALESFIEEVTTGLDNGLTIPAEIYTAIKILAPEWAWFGADQLMQLLGGRGYIESNMAPQIMRDCRVLRIFEGPTEVMCAYLGAQIEAKSETLKGYMCQQLGASKLFEELMSVSDEVVRIGYDRQARFQDRRARKAWVQYGLGNIAAATIALAATQKVALSNNDPMKAKHFPGTIEWCRRTLDNTISMVLDGLTDSSRQISRPDLEEVVSSYSNSIGEIEQRAPNAERTPSPWLQKNPETNNHSLYQSYGSGIKNAKDKKDAPQASAVSRETEEIQAWITTWLSEELEIPESEIDVGANLTVYGIDSVIVMRLTGALSTWLKCDLPQGVLWDYPTIADAALFLSEFKKGNQTTQTKIEAAHKIDNTRISGPFKLSYAQERLWFLHQLEEDSSNYNLYTALKISGDMDVEILRRSFEQVISRHSILRARFKEVNDEVVQYIDPVSPWLLEVEDLSKVDEKFLVPVLKQKLEAEAKYQFDLSQGNLVRANLIRLARDEHIFQVNVHHIVSDGWSVRIFVSEISRLYDDLIKGENSRLENLSIQYVDFVNWQRQAEQEKLEDQELAYWRQQLEGCSNVNFPTDLPRPTEQTTNGKHLRFQISKAKTTQLKAHSQTHGTTLYNTLLTAFAVTLYRYTQQVDICIGSPVANRIRSELDPLIGMFVNTLPMRIDLSSEPSFDDLMARVQSVVKGAYGNQSIPFERLVDKLKIDRDLSRSPIFQVLFVLQSSGLTSDLRLGGLAIEPIEVETNTSKFDLSMEFVEVEGKLNGVLEYNADLFFPQTIERLVANYQTLLDSILEDSTRKISALPFQNPQEVQLLEQWNQTSREVSSACIHHLFERQALENPNKTAIFTDDEEVSYAQLDQRANQFANMLLEKGVKVEDRIALCFKRSPEFITTILGVLKAGAVYVPLDPIYPADRLEYMVQAAQVKIFIGGKDVEFDRSVVEQYLDIDECDSQLYCYAKANPNINYSPQQLLYLIFTSGSTGLPKCTGTTHHAECNLLHWYCADEGMEDERNLVLSSPGFDLTQKNLLGPLTCGSALVLADKYEYDAEYLLSIIEQKAVTWINCAPSAFYPLIEAEDEYSKLNSVRYVALGGEAIQKHRILPWLEKAECRLINSYGPSECTDVVCAGQIVEDDLSHGQTPSIGKAIVNTRLYILDRDREILPVGAIGEVYVGGIGVGPGYFNDQALSENKFLLHTFPDGRKERLYRTGDLARYRADGSIEYHDRADNQVKIRGFRVELGDIEANLFEYPGIETAVTVLDDEDKENPSLIAYYQAAEIIEHGEIRRFLKARLPDFMVPNLFVRIDNIPLNANGKIDRKALPKPDKSEYLKSQNFVAPETATEKILTKIWSEVLKVEPIGTNSDFFELGGHSLLATKVVSRVRKTFKVDIPLRVLFKMSTIGDMAMYLDAVEKARVDAHALSDDLQSGRQEMDI